MSKSGLSLLVDGSAVPIGVESERIIPFNVGSFSDDSGVLDMSMEDVILSMMDKEKNRAKIARDNEMEQEVLISFREAPLGLLPSLKSVCINLNVSSSMLTRCLSHQIVAWYENMTDTRLVNVAYNITLDTMVKSGYTWLHKGLYREHNYTHTHQEDIKSSIRSISWVRSKLSSMADPLGVPASRLFLVGLCQSLSNPINTTDLGASALRLREEVDNFRRFVSFRYESISASYRMLQIQAVRDGKVIPDLEDIIDDESSLID